MLGNTAITTLAVTQAAHFYEAQLGLKVDADRRGVRVGRG